MGVKAHVMEKTQRLGAALADSIELNALSGMVCLLMCLVELLAVGELRALPILETDTDP